MSTGSDLQQLPPRRACLSVPGSSERMLAKARTMSVDEVVLDLEDAVALDAKLGARELVVSALADWTGPRAAIRVNPPRTPWCHSDLIALAAVLHRPLSVVVPKVESTADLAFVERLLDGVEAAAGISEPLKVQALIETPAGLNAATQIAGSSSRLEALILGYADLGAALGRTHAGAGNLDLWLHAQETLLSAARAHELQAIDGPFLGTADDAPFRSAARRARALGFDGKWAIHPSQLQTLGEIFTPGEEELGHARAVIDALEAGGAQSGAGAVALDGEMLDEASRRAALRTLARAREDV